MQEDIIPVLDDDDEPELVTFLILSQRQVVRAYQGTISVDENIKLFSSNFLRPKQEKVNATSHYTVKGIYGINYEILFICGGGRG